MPDIQIIAGGTPVPSTVLVSADQTTILGDGSAERPLHAASGGGIQFPSNRSSSGLFHPGSVAYQTATPDLSGLAQGDDIDTSYVTGLMISEGGGIGLTHPIVVQNSGPVTLTTAEWDAVTGGSGGLVANAQYWLSDATAGHLTTSKPSTGGNFATLVGIALDATTLLLQIMAPIAL